MSNPDQTPESDNNGIARQQELDREQAANISRRSLLLGLGVTLGTGIAASSSATASMPLPTPKPVEPAAAPAGKCPFSGAAMAAEPQAEMTANPHHLPLPHKTVPSLRERGIDDEEGAPRHVVCLCQGPRNGK